MVEGDILNLFSFDPDQFLIQIYVTLLFPTYRNYLFKPASQVGFFCPPEIRNFIPGQKAHFHESLPCCHVGKNNSLFFAAGSMLSG